MTLRFGPIGFAIAFCCTYAAAYWFNQPLFIYYPEPNTITWGPTIMPNAGPGMVWYGLMVDSSVVALLFSFLVPDRWLDRVFRNFLWVFPCAAMLVCAYLLRLFFK